MTNSPKKRFYHYLIDDYGNWFCEGNPVTDQDLLNVLNRSLFEDQGSYFIRCEGETHPVEVRDAPLWVRYVHIREDSTGRISEILIELKDGRQEALAAQTLTLVDENAIYCLATKRHLKARFCKTAYYELARYVEQDAKGYFITIAGKRHYLVRK